MSGTTHNTQEEFKTHRGETKVGLTVVKGAPYYSTVLGKLFANKGLAKSAEKKAKSKQNKRKLENKLKDLQKFGIGGNKIKYGKKRR
jgi:hypothetical protein